jgi:hypothetical protein
MSFSQRDLWDTRHVRRQLSTRSLSELKVVGWKFVALMTAVVALGRPEGWTEVGVMVAVNAVMFVRIGQHLRALASSE